MRRPIVSSCVFAFVLIASGGAFAAANNEPPPPTYPVDDVLSGLQNTERSLPDQRVGRYTFESGIYGAARRAYQRYPSHYLTSGIDVRREAQVAIDSLGHMRPKLPYSHPTDTGNPDLYPDWDHDGAFGDSGGLDPNGTGDFDADTDEVADSAYFLIPCYTAADEWVVHRRYASGACDVEDAAAEPYSIGVAHELKIVNARGLVLDATLWLPVAAFAGSACPVYGTPSYADRDTWAGCVGPANLVSSGSLPGLVFANGLASRQEHYAWFAMRMVEEGYVVLTYDPAGQGESEGTFADTLGITDANRADEQFAGAVRDVQDAVRWFFGEQITRVDDNGPRLVARADPATNIDNPALGAIDLDRVGISGNSMGAISTLAYLDFLGGPGGVGADGRPLPRVAAAVSMSGARPTRAVVPIQFQTSDGDGSPLLVLPKVGGINLGQGQSGIGYELIKGRYDQLRTTSDPAPLSLIVMEGGTHTDHVNEPVVPRTHWGNALAADYAADWLNCYVLGDAAACASAVVPRPHLSRIYASEQDPDGPAGVSVSRCITVPDAWSFNQGPQDWIAGTRGTPRYDCTP